MNTDARRKASAAYHAKRTSEGAKKVTVWLGPEALAALATLATAHGSKDAAVCAALTGQTLGQEVRAWIEADPAPKPGLYAPLASDDQNAAVARKKQQAARNQQARAGLEAVTAKPAAPAEFKSRLKGQWKAP